jgi:hypothetical protein
MMFMLSCPLLECFSTLWRYSVRCFDEAVLPIAPVLLCALLPVALLNSVASNAT